MLTWLHSLSLPDPMLLGKVALQTAVALWFILIGLKLVGRRVFGELAPQDLLLIVLVAEAVSTGLVPQEAGFTGSMVSVTVLMLNVWLMESIPQLRSWLESDAVVLYERRKLNREAMARYHISEGDLEKVARDYGHSRIDDFSKLVLEGDGSITGVLRAKKRDGDTKPKTGKRNRPLAG